MKKITEIWNYLNGKKTAIGAAMLTAAFAITQIDIQVVQGIWHLTCPLWVAPTVQTLEWVGSLFSGVGLIHKSKK